METNYIIIIQCNHSFLKCEHQTKLFFNDTKSHSTHIIPKFKMLRIDIATNYLIPLHDSLPDFVTFKSCLNIFTLILPEPSHVDLNPFQKSQRTKTTEYKAHTVQIAPTFFSIINLPNSIFDRIELDRRSFIRNFQTPSSNRSAGRIRYWVKILTIREVDLQFCKLS